MSHFLGTQCWDRDLQHWLTQWSFSSGDLATKQPFLIVPDRFLSTLKVGSVFMAVFHDVYDLQSVDFDKLRSHVWTKQYCPGKTNWNILTSHCWCTGTNPVYIPYILYPILWRCTSTIKTHVANHLTLHPIIINSIDYNLQSSHTI